MNGIFPYICQKHQPSHDPEPKKRWSLYIYIYLLHDTNPNNETNKILQTDHTFKNPPLVKYHKFIKKHQIIIQHVGSNPYKRSQKPFGSPSSENKKKGGWGWKPTLLTIRNDSPNLPGYMQLSPVTTLGPRLDHWEVHPNQLSPRYPRGQPRRIGSPTEKTQVTQNHFFSGFFLLGLFGDVNMGWFFFPRSFLVILGFRWL